MKSVSSIIRICADNVKSDTHVYGYAPFTVDISKNKPELEFLSQGGFEWSEDDYLIVDMEFFATSRTFIIFDFNIGEENRVQLDYSIIPNHRIKIAVSMSALKSDSHYLMPRPGTLKGHNHGTETHISAIDRVTLRTNNIRDGDRLVIYSVYISKELPGFSVSGDIMVDKFGQNASVDFEGKFHDEKELCGFLMEEHKKAVQSHGYSNPDWNKYGGYKKLRFDKTGYFHTHFDGKRWWLVDPEGCAFLSNGICYGTRMGVHGFVDGMENLFEWLPGHDDEKFADAWTNAGCIPEFVKRNGEQAGRSRKMFNFARANMIRVFGGQWWEKWVDINSARLREWGFNTISVCVNNYEDERVYDYLKRAKIPYTWTLKRFPKTSKMIFRDFPDVFSPEYAALCEEFAKQLEPLADDPYMIGYFINNEPEWIVEEHINITERLLVSREPLCSKQNFVNFVKEKYGCVESFNEAWGFDISEFNELLSPIDEEKLKSPAILCDLDEFKDIMVSYYNKIPCDAVKKYAPNNMCLGMRYPQVREGYFAGSDFFDSFSFNCYSKDPKWFFDKAEKGTTTPFMVGEWHYGSYDTEYLCTALVACKNEDMRGKACSNYIKLAFSCPQMVGAHYFEYNDQPFLGRFDGEAMAHGVITVTNRPRTKCLEYFAAANNALYEIALGNDSVPMYEVEFSEKI